MHKIATALAAMMTLVISPAMAATYPPLSAQLGMYIFPNPGTGGNPDFDQEFDAFATALGQKPRFYSSFNDDTQNLKNVAGSQYWWANPLRKDPRFANQAITEVIGLPMAATGDAGKPSAAIARFNAIAAGTLDAQWRGVVDVWHNVANIKTIVVRLGYEMNGNWMPWAVPATPAGIAAWIAAFRHVSQVMHAEGAKIGETVLVSWNPSGSVNYEGTSPDKLYPGDDVVDIMGLDIYSNAQWSGDFTNWSAGMPLNASVIGRSSTLVKWASSWVNREHFWMYPDATAQDPNGARHNGWGMAKHLAFAKLHKKPVSIDETGIGADPGAPYNGIDDDGFFPQFLWCVLYNYPYGVHHVQIWSLVQTPNINMNFLPGTKDPHPLAKASWRYYFGDGGTAATAALLQANGIPLSRASYAAYKQAMGM